MANQYGTEHQFKVYKIVSNGSTGDFQTAYSLVYVKSFDDRTLAEDWLINHGERHADYTILETFRNK
jgi:hypothetical protein